eukprot:scaffold18597_cov63-Phaeocystis_antarctica.AAC.8
MSREDMEDMFTCGGSRGQQTAGRALPPSSVLASVGEGAVAQLGGVALARLRLEGGVPARGEARELAPHELGRAGGALLPRAVDGLQEEPVQVVGLDVLAPLLLLHCVGRRVVVGAVDKEALDLIEHRVLGARGPRLARRVGAQLEVRRRRMLGGAR